MEIFQAILLLAQLSFGRSSKEDRLRRTSNRKLYIRYLTCWFNILVIYCQICLMHLYYKFIHFK